ncbi:MAG: glycine cleavage T C-terminal barrel domain-containing protein [Vicinamibacteria bacterium]
MKTEDAVTRVREGAGWTRLDRLSLIRVAGPQRVKFLHGLLSNDIVGLAPGQSRLAALMNLKGQQVAWMRVLSETDSLICELPLAVRDAVIDTFVHYKVGAPVRFEKVDAVVFGLYGGQASEALIALGLTAVPLGIGTFVTDVLSGSPLRISRSRDAPAQGLTIHVDQAAAIGIGEKLRAHLGEAITTATLDTLRVEEGLPWHGIDVTEDNLLHETGQLAAYHSASKGCYLGQEVVARLEGRGGHVNKRLLGLRCEQPVCAGDDISADGKVIGRVTSAGVSPEFGAIAMGYLHRSHTEPGTRVQVGRAEAEVAALPFRS